MSVQQRLEQDCFYGLFLKAYYGNAMHTKRKSVRGVSEQYLKNEKNFVKKGW